MLPLRPEPHSRDCHRDRSVTRAACGTQPAPQRGKHADEPSTFGVIFADARDRIGRAKRALAGYDDIAVRRHDEVKWAEFWIVMDQKLLPSAIGRDGGEYRVVALPIWANARRQKQPARGVKSEAARKRYDPGW